MNTNKPCTLDMSGTQSDTCRVFVKGYEYFQEDREYRHTESKSL